MTEIKSYLRTGSSNDTIKIDGSDYANYDPSTPNSISINSAQGSNTDAILTGNGTDKLDIANGVHVNGRISLGSGSNTVTLGDNVVVEGNIYSQGGDGADDNITIGEFATVNGSLLMANGDDIINVKGKLGDGVGSDQIDGSEGNNQINIGSTADVHLTRITMGSSNGSSLNIASGAVVTLTDDGSSGSGILPSAGDDNLYLNGTIKSDYVNDIYDGNASDDSFTLGSDFLAPNIGPNGEFTIFGGGNSRTLDQDTLDISELQRSGRISSVEMTGPESGIIKLTDGTIDENGNPKIVSIIEFSEIENFVQCFARGTEISVESGTRKIEELRAGDMIMTRDNGYQPVRWIGSQHVTEARLMVSPKLRPIRIKAGALGNNTPSSDLVVSPQHRILVRSKIAQRMFSSNEVLIAAKHLLAIDGIEVASDLRDVEYFHILFDRHEMIISNGAETESLYTGKEAIKSLSQEAREEIFTLFPELREQGDEITPLSARPLIAGRLGRKLAERHFRNGQPVVL